MQAAATGTDGHAKPQLVTAAVHTEPERPDHSQEDIDQQEYIDRNVQLSPARIHRSLQIVRTHIGIILHVSQPEVACRQPVLHLFLKTDGIFGSTLRRRTRTDTETDLHLPQFLFTHPQDTPLFHLFKDNRRRLAELFPLNGSRHPLHTIT